MCGRFALTTPASTIAGLFEVDVPPDLLPRYNIAPTTAVSCVVQQEGGRRLRPFRWGLIPSWAKDRKIANQTLNARAETIATRAAFRAAFKHRRLLVVADGFYEWQKDGKRKIPHLIQMADGRPFGMAGVWERWIDPESGEEIHSCSIVTTTPNALMAPIHDRMPVILPRQQWADWLDPSVHDTARLQEMLAPHPAEGMKERRVAKEVGNARNDRPEVQGPWIEDPATA